MEPIRVMTFIDGTWLWHNIMALNLNTSTKLDFEKLPSVITSYIGAQLNKLLINQNTLMSVSLPTNVHPDDQAAVTKQETFFNTLEGKCKYTIDRFTLDFKGKR